MSLLSTITELYRSCFWAAGASLRRTWLALGALLIAQAFLMACMLMLGPLGIVGGFIYALLHAGAVGWYLCMVEEGVKGRQPLVLSDFPEFMGRYLSEVISVLFIFWIASMILLPISPTVFTVAGLIAALAFNPVPEMIYFERSSSLGLLRDSLRFMQENWPEWIGAHLVAFAALLGWIFLVSPGDTWQQAGGLVVVQVAFMFGPGFGFIMGASVALGLGTWLVPVAGTGLVTMSALKVVGGLLMLVFVHFFMLFRGHLYGELAHSSRRGRQWKAKQR